MKNSKLAFLSMAVAALLPSVVSCRSDESPFGWTFSQQKADATIQLRLNVEETRAGEVSSSEEDMIKKLNVLVFNENNTLETSANFTLEEGQAAVSLEVSHGLKTIYVVAAKEDFYAVDKGKMTDFENSIFGSKLTDLKTSDGFMMIGKSARQQVMISSSSTDLPSSNVFSINLERLVAKTQVKSAQVDGSAFGIEFGDASFKAFQLNDKMRVVADGRDVISYVDNDGNGTYEGYTVDGEGYLDAVADFSGSDCAYLSENIVSNPVSGNTTFLGIRFATRPAKYYTFDSADKSVKESSEETVLAADYYTVGVQNKSAGVVDYVLVPGSKNILTFKTQEDAEAYASSLNNGVSSAVTVSQTESPMSAPAFTRAAATFDVIKFDKGSVYYRVNIAHKEGADSQLKVLRNRFYKVNINSVSSLGFSSDELLRPTDPASGFDTSNKSWISVAISVDPWVEIEQNADL